MLIDAGCQCCGVHSSRCTNAAAADFTVLLPAVSAFGILQRDTTLLEGVQPARIMTSQKRCAGVLAVLAGRIRARNVSSKCIRRVTSVVFVGNAAA